MSAGIGWCWLVSSITPKSRLQSFLCCCKQSKLKDEPLFSFACKCFSHMLAGLILWNAIFKYKNRKPNRLVYRLATALLPMYLFVLVRTELAWSHRRLMMSHLKHAEQVGFFVCFMKKKSAVMPIWMCIYAKTTFYPFYVFIKLKIEKWNLFGLFFFGCRNVTWHICLSIAEQRFACMRLLLRRIVSTECQKFVCENMNVECDLFEKWHMLFLLSLCLLCHLLYTRAQQASSVSCKVVRNTRNSAVRHC